MCVDNARNLLERYAALHRHILDVFNEYGVQIMVPAYEGDTETPKIVPKERWFTAPAVPLAEQSPPIPETQAPPLGQEVALR